MLVDVGLTTKILLFEPLFQVYVLAPDTVNVVEFPTHIVGVFIDNTGFEFTITFDVNWLLLHSFLYVNFVFNTQSVEAVFLHLFHQLQK